jgi:hypothetical protein
VFREFQFYNSYICQMIKVLGVFNSIILLKYRMISELVAYESLRQWPWPPPVAAPILSPLPLGYAGPADRREISADCMQQIYSIYHIPSVGWTNQPGFIMSTVLSFVQLSNFSQFTHWWVVPFATGMRFVGLHSKVIKPTSPWHIALWRRKSMQCSITEVSHH